MQSIFLAEGAYFNCGVMLMNLDELRKQDFFERAVEFLNRKSSLPILGSVRYQFSSLRTDSTSYPNIGIERPGASMRSRTTIWTACFTTRRRRRGSVERAAQLRSCLNDLQWMPVCLSIGRRRISRESGGKNCFAMRLHLFGRSLFHWYRCFTKLPDKTKNVRRIRNRRGIGSIIFSTRRAGVASIASAIRKLVE